MAVMDPFAVLGVSPDASPQEVAEAYRRLARRWHPDRVGGHGVQQRMAEVNTAYDAVRRRRFSRRPPPEEGDTSRAATRRAPAAAWLAEPVRRALGHELLAALHPREDVAIVTPTATWASARALLAVTDRRLLWLHDDAVAGRVRSLGFSSVAEIEHRLSWPRRRAAVLRLRTTAGRRLSFAELPPEVATAIAQRVAVAAT
jgi:hypothetical protein